MAQNNIKYYYIKQKKCLLNFWYKGIINFGKIQNKLGKIGKIWENVERCSKRVKCMKAQENVEGCLKMQAIFSMILAIYQNLSIRQLIRCGLRVVFWNEQKVFNMHTYRTY